MSNTNDDTTIPMRAADRLSRIQWENIAFIGFHIWFLGMAVDAVSLFSFLAGNEAYEDLTPNLY
jgi:hypothetical protein